MGGHVIVLVIHVEDGTVRILADPALEKFIQGGDQAQVDTLLKDFSIRAKADPDTFCRQLSSLNWGPLVTVSVGNKVEDDPRLASQTQHFVPIS